MVGIQSVSARIGRVIGEGLASNLRRWHGKGLLIWVIGLLVIANTINIAADLAAIADAVRLVAGGSNTGWIVMFGTALVLLQIFIPYIRYVRVLKWPTLSLLAHVGAVFTLSLIHI